MTDSTRLNKTMLSETDSPSAGAAPAAPGAPRARGRRRFLVGSAAAFGGLSLGFHIPHAGAQGAGDVVDASFDRLDPVFLLAGAAFGPSLMRFLTPEDASHVAMWAARLVVSYLQSPSDDLDPGREDTARHLVVTYLLPGLEPAA